MSLSDNILPKAQGRHRRDPEATRASILASAQIEFAEHGLKGGRIDRIADRAKANKQLVYYYFGGKEDLYRAALEATYAEIRERETELDLSALSPVDAMKRLIEFSLDYLNSHREFIRLLADENAQGAKHLHDSEMAQRTNSPLLRLVSETLERGVEEGVFRKGIDPLNLYISIAGMTYFYFANGATLTAIFGRNLDRTDSIVAYRDHIVSMTINGLRA
ncbi:TetR family transcriptional regulator [Roseovarius sp. HI0049]|nr:TetR family transcriptional regulator [Roseovarius sp. HI0049]